MDRRKFLSASWAVAAALVTPNQLFAAGERPSSDLIARAQAALDHHKLSIPHRDFVGVADFGVHSSKPRFHLIDMENGRATSFLVAHGKGSDPARTGWLQRFSNAPGSNATSSGSYVTGDAYFGQHGRSRRLIGLDPENSEALPRAIVVHGANYVSSARASAGSIGRSFGCFAFAEADIDTILGSLDGGRLILAGSFQTPTSQVSG